MKQSFAGSSSRLTSALKNSRAGFSKKIARLGGLMILPLLLAAASVNAASIYVDGFEGVVVSGSSANSGGTTGDPNLNLSASSWSSTGSFTTFGGTSPTTPTALSLSNSSATTTTFTATIPVAGCYEATMTGLSFNYRATSTSYNFITVKVNGTVVMATSASTTSSFFLKSATFGSPIVASSTITLEFVLSGGTHGSGGTFRLDNVNLVGTVGLGGSACSGTPNAGTVTGGGSTFCGSGSEALALTGASTGCGIHYQWEKSTDNITFTSTGVADTFLAYNTGTVTNATSLPVTNYYRVASHCDNAPLGTQDNVSPSVTLTLNPLPAVGTFSGYTNPVVIGTTPTIINSVGGGFWNSSSTIATIDGAGLLTPVYGGTTTISYTTANGYGCTNTANTNVNIVWPNTLALYAGSAGTSTDVIPVAGDNVNTLAYTGSLAGTCASGGFSGMTVPTSIVAFGGSNPHVFYKVKPDANKALNVFRIVAKTRSSNTGASKAVIAISRDGGATWAAGAERILHPGGSCGANSDTWSMDTTITGITDSILVAVFPYASGAVTGTFQLQTLEVYGVVTSDTACNRKPIGGYLTPSLVYICDTGSRWLSLDSNVFTGDAGVGISYLWQSSTNATTWSNAAGSNTNINYNTGTLIAGVSPATIYYRVVTTCALGVAADTAHSTLDTVNVNPTPTAATIGNLPSYMSVNKYLEVGLSQNLTTVGGSMGASYLWFSNDTSAVSIIESTGVATANLPGVAYITLVTQLNGCSASSKDTISVVFPGTIAAYTGFHGTSTAVVNFVPSSFTVTPLAQTGFGVNTACGFGGISGLTNNGVYSYSATGAHAYFKIKLIPGGTPGHTVDISTFAATLRRSTSGLQNATLAYSFDGVSWVDDGLVQSVDYDDCGYSHNFVSYGNSVPSLPDAGTGSDSIYIGVYLYDPAAVGGTGQINTIDVIGAAARPSSQSVASSAKMNDVNVYPNPASTVLNISSSTTVNATILSVDGKVLIEKNDAKNININGLASGFYLIKLYDNDNKLVKATTFSKQ